MKRCQFLCRCGATVVTLLALATVAFAQPPSFGGRGDSDDRGGRGGDSGGRGGFFPGGPGGGFPGGPGGGFPGGPGGGGGMPGPADFLRRLDANDNGMIDPEEAQGRAQFFLERIARDIPNLDFSRPVPIGRLASMMERAQRDRFGGSSDNRDGDNRGGDSRSSAGSSVEPLVPGFDLLLELPPVLGFGTEAERFTVQIDDRDRRYAEDRMRRYDRNGDGFLNKEELADGRWSDDPFQFDRNRDGRISADELSVRYAQRRVAEEQRNGNSSSSSGSASSRGGSSSRGSAANQPKFFMPPTESVSSSTTGGGTSGGGEVDERMSRMAEFMMGRYDQNRNGTLERDEWSGMPSDPSESDRNRDGKIDKNELAEWMSRSSFGGGWGGRGGGDRDSGSGGGGFSFRGGDRGGGDRGGSDRGGGDRGGGDRGGGDRGGDAEGGRFFRGSAPAPSQAAKDEKAGAPASGLYNGRTTYRAPTQLERLEKAGQLKELPSWFVRDDANHDAQVSMAEYASTWSDVLIAEFFSFDSNKDGLISVVECLAASKAGAVRGAGDSSASSGGGDNATASRGDSRFFRPRSGESAGGSGAGTAPAPAAAAPAAPPAKLSDKIQNYAKGLVDRYDKNKDGALDAAEQAEMTSPPDASADADKNGTITAEELAAHLSGQS
jgi:hypothetical protein